MIKDHVDLETLDAYKKLPDWSVSSHAVNLDLIDADRYFGNLMFGM